MKFYNQAEDDTEEEDIEESEEDVEVDDEEVEKWLKMDFKIIRGFWNLKVAPINQWRWRPREIWVFSFPQVVLTRGIDKHLWKS